MIENLEKMPEFQCGLWYSPHVKIYSIGGSNRIAEISNYPRAYKDLSDHLDEYGEPLPGAFPLWLESEELPFTAGSEEPLREVVIHQKLGLPNGKVILSGKPADKQVIRIKYQRVF